MGPPGLAICRRRMPRSCSPLEECRQKHLHSFFVTRNQTSQGQTFNLAAGEGKSFRGTPGQALPSGDYPLFRKEIAHTAGTVVHCPRGQIPGREDPAQMDGRLPDFVPSLKFYPGKTS
jgi:hypothetical protein